MPFPPWLVSFVRIRRGCSAHRFVVSSRSPAAVSPMECEAATNKTLGSGFLPPAGKSSAGWLPIKSPSATGSFWRPLQALWQNVCVFLAWWGGRAPPVGQPLSSALPWSSVGALAVRRGPSPGRRSDVPEVAAPRRRFVRRPRPILRLVRGEGGFEAPPRVSSSSSGPASQPCFVWASRSGRRSRSGGSTFRRTRPWPSSLPALAGWSALLSWLSPQVVCLSPIPSAPSTHLWYFQFVFVPLSYLLLRQSSVFACCTGVRLFSDLILLIVSSPFILTGHVVPPRRRRRFPATSITPPTLLLPDLRPRPLATIPSSSSANRVRLQRLQLTSAVPWMAIAVGTVAARPLAARPPCAPSVASAAFGRPGRAAHGGAA